MKKGSLSLTVRGVALFIAVVVLIPVVAKFIWFVVTEGEDAKCRISTQIALKNQMAGKSITSIECKRHELLFEKKDVDNEQVFSKIEERIRACWANMLNGESEQFNSYLFLIDQKPCLVCAEIEFSPEIETPALTGFGDHLRRPREDGRGTWEAVYESTFEVDTPVIVFKDNIWEGSEILTNEKYYLIYKTTVPPWRARVPGSDALDDSAVLPIVRGEDLERLGCSYLYN